MDAFGRIYRPNQIVKLKDRPIPGELISYPFHKSYGVDKGGCVVGEGDEFIMCRSIPNDPTMMMEIPISDIIHVYPEAEARLISSIFGTFGIFIQDEFQQWHELPFQEDLYPFTSVDEVTSEDLTKAYNIAEHALSAMD